MTALRCIITVTFAPCRVEQNIKQLLCIANLYIFYAVCGLSLGIFKIIIMVYLQR